MAFEPIFPFEGNLIADPDLRFTPNGVAVCNIKVGINDPRPEQNNGKTVPALIAEFSIWRDMAEHAAETLAKGMRVTGKGKMIELDAYLPRNGGNPQATLKAEALEIGPSLRWAQATVVKVAGQNQNRGGNQQQGGGNQGQQQGQQGGWNNQQGGNQGGSWGGQQGQQGQQGGDPWGNGNHPGQQQGNQGGGWGSDQGWGGGGNQGGDAWGN